MINRTTIATQARNACTAAGAAVLMAASGMVQAATGEIISNVVLDIGRAGCF